MKATKTMQERWIERGKEILKPGCTDLRIENISRPFVDDEGMLDPNYFTALTFTDPKGNRCHISVGFL